MVSQPPLKFEGVVGYATADAEAAAHFFEHTLGLELAADEDGVRFYPLGDGTTAIVDVRGKPGGHGPYLVFSTDDVTAAAEHFLQSGCAVGELPWAEGAGFIAQSPDGHAVAVLASTAMEEDLGTAS